MQLSRLLKTKLAATLVVVLCAALAGPAVAGAQQVDPTTSQYGSELTQINKQASAPSDTGDNSGIGGRVGPLPFTGFDVIAMAAVALAVTGLGLGLQRAVSRQATDAS